MSGYIGKIPVPQATQVSQKFTATAGQTQFTTVGFTSGYVVVWLNGVKLVPVVDYSDTDNVNIVLTSGAAAGDTLEILAFETFTTANDAGGGLFKGNNGTTGDGNIGRGDIIRVHTQTLDTDVTIDATENALAAGPLTVASGVTLTVTTGGNLSIV
jgi:hypothetical protein